MPEVEVEILPGHALSGFPSGHGPGLYLVDYEERTIRPKPVEQGETLAQEEPPPESHPVASDEQSEGEVQKEESVAPAEESETMPVE